MILEQAELKVLYESVVKSSGHPDRMGYMARIMLTSGGDPDYIDISGRVGLMPVDPSAAAQITGATDVQSIQGNVLATIAMDMLIFQQTMDVEMMIREFHREDSDEILSELDEARIEVDKFLHPRRATVEDVMTMIADDEDEDVPHDRMIFFEALRSMY